MSTLHRLAFAACAAPLALALAACGSSGDEAGAPTGDTIAPIAAPAGTCWTETVSVTPDGGDVMGNPDAPLKLVEYGSLSCPHCARLAQEGFPELTSDYIASGRVSLEFRSFAIHPQDAPLTLLTRCGGPEKVFPLTEELYRNFDAVMDRAMQNVQAAQAANTLPPEQRLGALSDALGFTDFFAARGISEDQAHSCLADMDAATKFAQQAQAYTAAGINQTPTLVLNGVTLHAPTWGPTGSEPGLKAALEKAGAR
jgi:protein-disulfide isomerase